MTLLLGRMMAAAGAGPSSRGAAPTVCPHGPESPAFQVTLCSWVFSQPEVRFPQLLQCDPPILGHFAGTWFVV